MVELQAGLGFGIKKFSLVWVFEKPDALAKFVGSGFAGAHGEGHEVLPGRRPERIRWSRSWSTRDEMCGEKEGRCLAGLEFGWSL